MATLASFCVKTTAVSTDAESTVPKIVASAKCFCAKLDAAMRDARASPPGAAAVLS